MTGKPRIKLPLLGREITKRTGQPAPSYRRLYAAVLNGAVPAERGPDGWSVADDDVPAIAELFGIAPPKTAA